MGEVEKLRQARETMNSVFPLSPALWQEWAKDEASLSTRFLFPFPHEKRSSIMKNGADESHVILGDIPFNFLQRSIHKEHEMHAQNSPKQ